MMKSIIKSKFITWACRSLLGNIVLLELTFGLTIFVSFSFASYSNGDFTLDDAIFYAFLGLIGGVITGVMFWFGLSRPLLDRRGIKASVRKR